jgi:hypothetical protein
VLFGRYAQLAHPRTVAELPEAVRPGGSEPAVTSELFWGLHAWYRRLQHVVASRVPLAARRFTDFDNQGGRGWTKRRQEPLAGLRGLADGEHLAGQKP